MMKKFVLMHVGFEMPTEEVMEAWNKWFEYIKEYTVENIGLGNAKEISSTGEEIELGWDKNSITGMSIIEVESMQKAVELAKSCPSITGIRVYEVRV